mmetsp:Transcript_40614/g.130974  ORF Transcript_40614/g.130974 Transcript_40614/m.130974 type:complete len:288 (-) Transcript_40614:186-1049(-)
MVPPARSRSDEIDGNLVVMSGAGAVRPQSLVWLALHTVAGTMDTCGVSWWQSGSESLLTSLLGTSARSLLGNLAVQHVNRTDARPAQYFPSSLDTKAGAVRAWGSTWSWVGAPASGNSAATRLGKSAELGDILMISDVCSSSTSVPTTSTSASWARIFSPTSLYRLALISFEPPPPPLPLSPPPPALEPVQAASSGPRLSPPSTPSPPPLWTMATFYDQSLAPLKYDDGGTLLSRIAATATSWGRLGHWCDVATPRLSSISLSSASRLFGFAQPVAPRRSARIAARG